MPTEAYEILDLPEGTDLEQVRQSFCEASKVNIKKGE